MIKLTELQKSNRAKCIAFADEFVNPDITLRDKTGTFSKTLWEKCSQLNLHGVFVSEKNGGLNYSLQDGLSLFESIGFSFRDNGLSFGIAAQQLSCAITIDKYASNENHIKLLNDIVNGKLIVAHAITEKSSGSNVFDLSSGYSLQNDNNSISIKGEKTYCSNLPVADYMLCYSSALDDLGKNNVCSAFLISTRELGDIKYIDKMGLNTCLMGEVNFEINVDTDALIGKEGTGVSMFQEAITYERLGMASLHLGTIERLINEAIEWVKNRKSGSTYLSSHQAITHNLVKLHNEWLTTRSYMYYLTSKENKFSKLFIHASILKDKVSELYVDSCLKILQIYGGLGYTKKNEIERMMRDAMASKIYSGTSEIQKEIVWKFIS